MTAKLLLLACVALGGPVAAAASPADESRWVLDANGCKFLNPAPPSVQFTITWTGQCVDGFVSGHGEVRAGNWFAYIGEFSQGRIVKGVAEMNGSTYEGEFLDNLPHGPGVTTERNGLVAKGRFDRGKIDPKEVEFTWPDATHYRGEIDPRTMNMHGKGVLEYAGGGVYEGEFKQDQPNGTGVLKYPDGEVRQGTFVAGQLSGTGSILYANQTRYQGALRAGEPNGQGRMEFTDGQFYEGAFVSGKYQGKGKLKYSTGGQYEGDFLAGDASGSGTMVFADGRRYEGQFLLGKMNGTGKLTHTTGESYEGEWKSGELTGKCHIVIGQSIYDGQCIDSQASGSGRLEDKSKQLDYQGEFAQDQFNGKGSLHLGQLAYQGMFKAGVIEGPGVLTLPTVTMRGDFKSGVLVRGTVAAGDGRTFEIDAGKGEILEVQKDGTKRPLDQLPSDITI
jgi:hypothetical protein